jgi:site-specific DNA recombinase
VFGYRHVAIANNTELDRYGRPKIEGVRLAIDSNQAKTVIRIFERYAAGDSMKRIAMDLNADRVASPQARPGRSQSWAQSSVRHVLLNEQYRGVVIWGKTKKVRAPETGKRIYRRRPESEWRRVEVPEQRIVSEKLWTRTLERIHMVRDLYGVADGKRRGRAAASPYLFTGLLECSECGGSITIVSGRSRNREDSRYGCSAHAQRGNAVCTNALLVRRAELEPQLLGGLRERVIHPDVVDYTLKRFEEEIAKALTTRLKDTDDLRREESELERGMANQLRGVADGYSPYITAAIATLEAQLAAVRSRIDASNPQRVNLQLRDTRRFVTARVSELSALWDGEPRIAREEIAKHVRKIRLQPRLRTYVATGTWDWLGVLGRAAVMMVPGARIELATPAFSGRRSTSELPRHGGVC